MRYQSDISEQPLSIHAHDDMLLFTSVLAVIVGLALVWMGKKGGFMWMWTWGAGLIMASICMGLAVVFIY